MMGPKVPRRRFITSAALGAGLLARRVHAAGPDDSVRVGLIGCGSRGPYLGCRKGKAFHGTNGTLVLSRGGYRIYADARDGKKAIEERASEPTIKEHVVMQKHVRSFIDCVVSRRKPECSIEVGHGAANPGHLMNIAWRVGRRVPWDAAREVVRDDQAAQALVTKQYRRPWVLPT